MHTKRRRKKTLSIVKELEEYKNNPSRYHWRFPIPRGIKRTPQGRYVAQIKIAGSTIHIGTYDSLIQAMLAYDKYIYWNKLSRTTNFIVEP